MTLSRRDLLRHAGAGLGAGLGLGTLALACAPRDLTPLAEALRRAAVERQAVAAIGQTYAAAHADESLRVLLERLSVQLDWRDGMTDAELAARLVARIEADFRDARTVSVDSWILSQSEARWAAVVALG